MRLRSIAPLAALVVAPGFAHAAAKPSPDTPGAALWAAASKGAAAELRLYLGQYPHGHFASQAKAALAALDAHPATATGAATAEHKTTQAPSPAPIAKSAAHLATSKATKLKPGWLVEVRAMHHQTDANGQINTLKPLVPSAVPLAIKPLPGPAFDTAKLAQSTSGAGRLPALGGSAKWLVKKAGKWGIGANIMWHQTGPCRVHVTVQDQQVIKRTTDQASYAAGSGDTSYSAIVSLTPGVYNVTWTLACQPSRLPGQDAALSMLVAPPNGALAAPTSGEFVYQPIKK